MANWRIAASLTQLRDQINQAYPNRSKVSDGAIGDVRHVTRASDHNPWVRDGRMGIVTAIDITHDPANGCDAGKLAAALVESKDRRIKYIIWNKRMVSSYPAGGLPPWTWRTYAGSNPHTKHVHISVQPEKSLYDLSADWQIEESEAVQPARTHIVQPGDTLGAISLKYFGSTLEYPRIMAANGLTSTVIRVGQTLIIPN